MEKPKMEGEKMNKMMEKPKMEGEKMNKIGEEKSKKNDEDSCCEEQVIIAYQGHYVCKNCGMTYTGLVFEKHAEFSINRESRGPFNEIGDPSSDLGTTIKKSEMSPSLRRLLKRIRPDYKQRIKREAKSFITNTSERLNLTSVQTKDCFQFFVKVWSKNNNKGIEIKAMMVAAMHIYLKIHGTIIAIKDFIDLYNLEQTKVENAIKRINFIIQANPDLKKLWSNTMDSDYWIKLLDSVNKIMNLDSTVYKNASMMLKSKKCIAAMKNENRSNSFGLVAGAIYVAMRISETRIPKDKIMTQDKIAEKLSVTVVTLRVYYQMLMQIFEQEINRAMHKKRPMTSTEEEVQMK